MERKKPENQSEIVHTIARINNREFLFIAKVIDLFFTLIHLIFNRYDATIYAAVIMTNHIHLMHHIPTQNPDTKLGERLEKKGILVTVGDLKRHFLSQFAKKANTLFNVDKKGRVILNIENFKGELRPRFGCLIENRSKSIPVKNTNHGLANLIYMFLNPVRAGIVRHPKDYQHSNYEMYASGIKKTGYEFHPEYLELGSTLEACAKIFAELIEEQLEDILKNLIDRANITLNNRESYFKNIKAVINFVSTFFHLRI